MSRISKGHIQFKAASVAKLYGYDEVAMYPGSKTNGHCWTFVFKSKDGDVQFSSWDVPLWTRKEAYQFLVALELAKTKLSKEES